MFNLPLQPMAGGNVSSHYDQPQGGHLPAPPAGLCGKGDGPGIPGRRLSFCTARAIIRCLFRTEHRGPCQRPGAAGGRGS